VPLQRMKELLVTLKALDELVKQQTFLEQDFS
jgi:hypothetical protein